MTAGQPFKRFFTVFTAGQPPCQTASRGRRRRGATRIRGRETSRPPTGGLLESSGTLAVLVPCRFLLALAAPKKGYGAPGAGCPVINYGYSRRRPRLEAVCIKFGQRYAAAAPYQPALAA